MTEEKKEMTNEEPIIITFDDVPYRASDLNEKQLPLAVDLKSNRSRAQTIRAKAR